MMSGELPLHSSERVGILSKEAEASCLEAFARTEAISEANTRRVLDAFRKFRVSDSLFAGTTGYGYDDRGRET